jgi:DNA-binding response OmpR family regulator
MGASILIIDDEKDIASTMQAILMNAGLKADVAFSGKKGLAAMGKYKLIILDLMMPGMSGKEVLIEMKKRKIHKKVMIVTALYILNDLMDELISIYPGLMFMSKTDINAELAKMARKRLEENIGSGQ